MKTKTTLGLAAAAALLAPTASAELILLAGINQFDVVADGSLTAKAADEGVLAGSSEIRYGNGSSATGGSTDNWYGPEVAFGGIMTNQVPFDTDTNPPNPFGTVNGPYVFEDDATGGDRLMGTYDDPPGAPTPSNVSAGGDSTTANGRIVNLNGTDLVVTNSSTETYKLGFLLFDSFVGDVSTSTDSTGEFNPFTINIIRGGSSVVTTNIAPTRGYAGHNSLSGEGVDDPLANPLSVNNEIDFGVGTNYLDYVVNLGGLEFAPGDRIEIGFAYTSQNGGILRGDNFALVAVPEPSSSLALAGLLGLGLMSRRRR